VRVASGYLSAGIQVLLLDEAGRPAAPGAPGELVVRTARAAIGEWIDGRLVTDRFPPDPRDPGRRIVRTGDIARICEDGVLVTLGRVDRMVKIGGLRVEPAAIELAMRAVPGVADAAVVAIQAAGTTRLVGFAVPAEAGPAPAGGADPLLDSIRAALRAGLPAAMLPASLRRIAAVPLTDGGKRDDRALQALAGRPG
jgi:acyl-coenzyme A synthetase/AMP-(fatty) acid ligase